MKKSFATVIAALLAASVWGQTPKPQPQPVGNAPKVRCSSRIGREGYGTPNWWLERLCSRRQQVDRAKGDFDLVFLGDSITHNFDMSRSDPRKPAPGHAAFLELEKRFSILNAGYSGDGYQHLLWRIRNGELEGVKAKCLMLNIGTNNTSCDPAETAAGIKAIVGELSRKFPRAKIVLMALFPRGADDNDRRRAVNRRVNELIRPLADGQRVLWVDLWPKFLDGNGDTKWIMPDRLHPRAEGYEKIWIPAVLPLFEASCGR